MSLKIRFVTDYVCPYCLISKIPLKEAIQGKDVMIEWIPYELTEEPAERIDTYHDPVRSEKWKESLVPICEEMQIDMKLPPNVVPRPYTRLAFEGHHFAKEHGKGEEYNDAMYTSYFTEEKDIGDINVLTAIAERIGLDGSEFRKALENGTYTDIQKALVSHAKNELKVQSVPTIYIGDHKLEEWIHTKKDFEKIISEALTKA